MLFSKQAQLVAVIAAAVLIAPTVLGIGKDIRSVTNSVATTTSAWAGYVNPNTWFGGDDTRFWT